MTGRPATYSDGMPLALTFTVDTYGDDEQGGVFYLTCPVCAASGPEYRDAVTLWDMFNLACDHADRCQGPPNPDPWGPPKGEPVYSVLHVRFDPVTGRTEPTPVALPRMPRAVPIPGHGPFRARPEVGEW